VGIDNSQADDVLGDVRHTPCAGVDPFANV
jgi:hypothetical protein